MKVLMINSVCGVKSTGRICTDIAELLEQNGDECKIAYGRDGVPEQYGKYAVKIGSDLDLKLHGLLTRLSDRHGLGSVSATKRFIKWAKEYDPDIIHLHNIHGYYINFDLLFRYLKESGKPVLWTLHDCWAFTGHCAHFDYNGCNKWKNGGCRDCRYISEYPKSLTDGAKRNFALKKERFNSLPNLTLTVASRWHNDIVKASFLRDHEVYVCPNGIDLTKFRRQESNFRKKNGLEDKYIVLCVASTWEKMKGTEYINRLAEDLPDPFRVVTVGNVGARSPFSDKILQLPATNSIHELCCLYSSADVFANPTLQETQGLTTVEALACGTPAVVFASGGAGECIDDGCGRALDRGDYEGFLSAVIDTCKKKPLLSDNCREAAKRYDKDLCYKPILELYKKILGEQND